MDKSMYQQLSELTWRKSLGPQEQARLDDYLRAHPESLADAEMERRLTRCLSQLPDAPISSNFTARVLQAARSQPAPRPNWLQRLASSWPIAPQWIPRVAIALVILCVLSIHQYNTFRQARMARNLEELGHVTALAQSEWLKDYDTIDRLDKVQVADNELLTALR
jgi:anti-sigma factor RsiW